MGKYFYENEAFPVVKRMIDEILTAEEYADRYAIVTRFLEDEEGKALVEKAKRMSAESLDEVHLVGNMVDWFNANITNALPKMDIYTSGYERVRVKRNRRNKNGRSSKVEVWAFYKNNQDSTYPDELDANQQYPEGAIKRDVVKRYERNPKARKKCIEKHGTVCKVCKFDFEKVYGELGRGYIHVHHKEGLSQRREEYDVDPENDLVPVCPNCHAMLHRKGEPPLSIETLEELVKKQAKIQNKQES